MAGIPPAPPVAPPPAPIAPIFRFVGGPAPHEVWVGACGSPPLVEVAVDEPFAALAQCREWQWTPHPPPPAVPTHLRCSYAWPELIFNLCCHSEEPAYVNSCPFALCTRPAHFGEVWTAISETGLIPLDTPINKLSVLLKLFLKAANTIRSDDRLKLTLARTCPVEPAPAGGQLSVRWPMAVTTRQLTASPAVSLFSQVWLLWRCRDRFTNAARIHANNPLAIIMEDARDRASQQFPLMAPFLALTAVNVPRIASAVGEELSKLVLPVELLRFPESPWAELTDATTIIHLVSGDGAQKEAAFIERLSVVLDHFSEVAFVLTSPAGSVLSLEAGGGFLRYLTSVHLSADHNPWSVGTIDTLNGLCVDANEALRGESDPPVEIAAKILYHERYLERLKLVRKAELKHDEGSGVSKIGGVKAPEFRAAVPSLEAICAQQHANPSAVFQLAFKSNSKVLVMYLMEMCTALPDFKIFTSLSTFRGDLDLYLAWCLSVESDGTVPRDCKHKRVGAKHILATKSGDWSDGLDVLNLCMLWELNCAGKTGEVDSFVPVEPHLWFLSDSGLKTIKKFGYRYFAGLNRAGGSEEDEGSFLWVMKTGMDLLDSKATSRLLSEDVDDIVQWWFHAALMEAWRLFHSETKSDTDYSKPLRDVFILRTVDGCIVELARRMKSRSQWSEMTEDLPFTMQALVGSSAPSGSGSRSTNTTVSSMSRLKNPVLQVPKMPSKRKASGAFLGCLQLSAPAGLNLCFL